MEEITWGNFRGGGDFSGRIFHVKEFSMGGFSYMVNFLAGCDFHGREFIIGGISGVEISRENFTGGGLP